MFLLTVLMVIAIVCMLGRLYTQNKKVIIGNRLDTIYDQMEMYIVKNNIRTSRAILDYLKRWKNFKVNNEFADIQILFLAYKNISAKEHELNKLKHKKELEKIPKELIILGAKFSKELDKLVFLSIFRSTFLVNILPILIIVSFKAIISFSTKPFVKLFSLLDEIRNEDIIISGNGNLGISS